MPTMPTPTEGVYEDLQQPSSEPPEDGTYYAWHFALENWVVCDPHAPIYTEGEGDNETILSLPPSWLFDDSGDGVWRPPVMPPTEHGPEDWHQWDENTTSWAEVPA